MSRNRKLNRDHAKKTQRPMVEDAASANQLEALVTKRDHLPRKLLSSLGTERSHSHPTFDGRGSVNSAMERRNRSNGTRREY